MSWRDRLRTPSWRGVPFDVESSDLAGGRRLAVHEYPQQDKPYAEDMGRAMLHVRLAAMVTGEDYFSRRDLLLEALETPGPGLLVHPHRGELTCSLQSYTCHEDVTGRIATFDLDFIESGEHEFPVSGLNAASLVDAAATAANAASAADFLAAWSIGGVAWTVLDAADAVGEAVDDIRAAVLGPLADLGDSLGAITLALDSLAADAAAIVSTPEDLVTSLQDVLAAVGAVGDAALDVFLVLTAAAGDPILVAVAETEADEDAAANRTSLDRIVRRTSIAEAARVSATVTFASYDEAVELRDVLADRLADEGEASGSADVVDALANLRGGVVDDITGRATQLARLRSLTPTTTLPACVLAYALYGDASRADEITDRNRLAHPGFVPVRELRVLAS
jgi:prophage DNA circulation protein